MRVKQGNVEDGDYNQDRLPWDLAIARLLGVYPNQIYTMKEHVLFFADDHRVYWLPTPNAIQLHWGLRGHIFSFDIIIPEEVPL